MVALTGWLPAHWKATMSLRAFGLLKIPLLFFVNPSVLELTGERIVVKIPLGFVTRNHLGSMYFGALAIGADCAGGLLAMKHIRDRGRDLTLVFKTLRADFLLRAEGDVHFTCEQGRAIAGLVETAAASRERAEMPVDIVATVPSKLGDKPVARFTLTLSLKCKRAR